MDYEGVDVNLTLPSGWFGTWTAGDDVALEVGMYRAYHRWMEDYCGAYPERLGGVILACARDVAGSFEEIRRWGKSRWAWGVMVYAPYGMPLDHPDLEPIWAAAAEHDLCVVLHTFTVMPPYAPGGLDTWENLFLQRSAAHPWCGMRNMAALIGSGVMDRYPQAAHRHARGGPRLAAVLDDAPRRACRDDQGRAARAEDEAQRIRDERPLFPEHRDPEGGGMTNAVDGSRRRDVLMYASDYPHGESHFPETVKIVLGLGDVGASGDAS